MELILRAKVQAILSMQKGVSKAGKEWAKASVLVEYGTDPKYPKQLMLSNFKEADKFSQLTQGAEYDFWIEPTSREYNGRWYSEVGCWKWVAVEINKQGNMGLPTVGDSPADIAKEPGTTEDLPF